MKHNMKITALLILIFFITQIVGILVTNQYLDYDATITSGNATFSNLPAGIDRPQVEESSSFIWIFLAILIGTVVVLTLIKFKKMRVWKMWFLLSVILTIYVALGGFFPWIVALLIALGLGLWKVFRPNIWVHNITEVFIYSGLAAIFVSMINLFSGFVLLLLISLYDMYAVWKSKHMIALAQAQSSNKLFAGLMIPYKKGGKMHTSGSENVVKKKVKTAILGGGDIGFPLIFTAVVFKTLIVTGTARVSALLFSFIVTVTCGIALTWLLTAGKKDRFYPAMPFISLGALAGYILLVFIKPELWSALVAQITGLF